MAIQIPNPGTGNGATGDNEFVLWTKVKDNFTNTTHAASRLVGTAAGNVMEVGAFGVGDSQKILVKLSDISKAGFYYGAMQPSEIDAIPSSIVKKSALSSGVSLVLKRSLASFVISTNGFTTTIFSYNNETNSVTAYAEVYTTLNTTKEPTTGYLKAASPILHLFNDDLVKEHEAVEQDIIVEKIGTGDYLIKGSTGLSSEGWNLSPPKDIHGNVLCMVEATEADGNINVKTYKRKFDFDIVAIVPDYDQPFDIPDGHSVDLRLNDLPQEPESEV